jgi:hypothetical protein
LEFERDGRFYGDEVRAALRHRWQRRSEPRHL